MAKEKQSEGESCPTFGGEGFNRWIVDLKCFMRMKGVWKYVTDDPVALAMPDLENDASADAVQRNRAFYLLRRALENSVLDEFPECQTAPALYNAVIAKYSGSDATSVNLLTQELARTRLTGSVDEYIKTLGNLYERLAAVGRKHEESEKVRQLLSGLTSNFLAYAQGIRAREHCSFKEAVAGLKVAELEYLQLRENDKVLEGSGSHESGAAMKAAHSRKCWNCGKEGHKAAECRSQARKGHGFQGKQWKRGAGFHICLSRGSRKDHWILDSGASYSLTYDRSDFITFEGFDDEIEVATGSRVKICGIGNVELMARVGDKWKKLTLYNVRYVPGLACKLISETAALQAKCTIEKNGGTTVIRMKDEVILIGKTNANAYNLHVADVKVVGRKAVMLQTASKAITLSEAHKRLGHVNLETVKNAVKHLGVRISSTEWKTCDACATAKARRVNQPKRAERMPKRPGEMLNIDIMGPIDPSYKGDRYIITAIDRHTGVVSTKELKVKSAEEVLNFIQDVVSTLRRYGCENPRIIRTDNGSEFENHIVNSWLKGQGIFHETTAPYSSVLRSMVDLAISHQKPISLR